LVKGKRNGYVDPEKLGHDAQLCTSNPEVVAELAESLTAAIEADPTIEIISFSPNDGGGFCECEKCKALDGPPRDSDNSAGRITPWLYSNRLAVLNNEVARRVAKRFPHVKIRVGAYGYYLLAAKHQGFRARTEPARADLPRN